MLVEKVCDAFRVSAVILLCSCNVGICILPSFSKCHKVKTFLRARELAMCVGTFNNPKNRLCELP